MALLIFAVSGILINLCLAGLIASSTVIDHRISSSSVSICGSSTQNIPIRCGVSFMIMIDSATTVYKDALQCGGPDTTGVGGNAQSACEIKQNAIFQRCYGRETCELKPSDATISLPGCSASNTTNFLVVQYRCAMHAPGFQGRYVRYTSFVELPMTGYVSSPGVHLLSPSFPDAVPPGKYNTSCTISATDYLGGNITFKILVNVLHLNTTDLHSCPETLQFTGTSVDTFCSPRQEWNTEYNYQVSSDLIITYSKQSEAYAGRFWLEIEGTNDQNTEMDLTSDCRDLLAPPVTTQSEESSNRIQTELIVGVSFAVVIICIMVVAMVIGLYLSSRKKKTAPSEQDEPPSNSDAQTMAESRPYSSAHEYSEILDIPADVNPPTVLPMGTGNDNERDGGNSDTGPEEHQVAFTDYSISTNVKTPGVHPTGTRDDNPRDCGNSDTSPEEHQVEFTDYSPDHREYQVDVVEYTP